MKNLILNKLVKKNEKKNKEQKIETLVSYKKNDLQELKQKLGGNEKNC